MDLPPAKREHPGLAPLPSPEAGGGASPPRARGPESGPDKPSESPAKPGRLTAPAVCVCVCSVHTHVCTRALSPPPRAFCVHGFVQAGIGNTQKQRPRDFPAAQCDAAGLRAHAESTRTGHAQAHACARTRTWPRTRVISHAFPSPSRSPETELPARQTPCAA